MIKIKIQDSTLFLVIANIKSIEVNDTSIIVNHINGDVLELGTKQTAIGHGHTFKQLTDDEYFNVIESINNL